MRVQHLAKRLRPQHALASYLFLIPYTLFVRHLWLQLSMSQRWQHLALGTLTAVLLLEWAIQMISYRFEKVCSTGVRHSALPSVSRCGLSVQVEREVGGPIGSLSTSR